MKFKLFKKQQKNIEIKDFPFHILMNGIKGIFYIVFPLILMKSYQFSAEGLIAEGLTPPLSINTVKVLTIFLVIPGVIIGTRRIDTAVRLFTVYKKEMKKDGK